MKITNRSIIDIHSKKNSLLILMIDTGLLLKTKAERLVQTIFDMYSLGDERSEKSANRFDNPPYH